MEKKKKKTSIGLLFWIALILLVIVIILFNLKQIDRVAKITGMDKLFNSLFKKGEPGKGTAATQKKLTATSTPGEIEVEEKPTRTPQPVQSSKPTRAATKKLPTETNTRKKTTPAVVEDSREPNLRNANLWFASIKADGKISFASVKRAVRFSDAPLKSTLVSLLKGPSASETESGLINLIPVTTELRNVYMRGNTAYLDFNENFSFNTKGKDGIVAQLEQIVFTCTEFINVHDVQILIEGQIVEYMGEGVYIGKPLTRDDF